MLSIAVITSQAFSLVNFRGPLLKVLRKRRIRVYALAPDFDDETRAGVRALGAEPVDYSLTRAGTNPVRDFADIAGLYRLLGSLKPDITLSYFIKPVIYGSIAACLVRVPRRYSMIEGLGYVFMEDAAADSLLQRTLRRLVPVIYKLALRSNEKVFFLNHEDLTQFLEGNLVRQRQVVRIDGTGLDLEHYAPSAPVLTPITFLLIARMLREKGVYDFIEAARMVRTRFSSTRFILVGGTDPNPGSVSMSDLQGWVDEGLVEWPGHVNDVRPWITRASVFVLPSYYREGVPRSSQEAMAMGRPVITTDWVGCRETVRDGVNGYLVPPRDPEALALAMQRFVEAPDLVPKMGSEGRRIAEERFDVNVINQQILDAMRLL